MRLLLIRHGDPDYAKDSLTTRGWAEARALADYLKQELPPQQLYTSPLGRARATASCSEELLGLSAEVEEWTQELNQMYMPDQKLMAWDMHGHLIHRAAEAGAQSVDWSQLDGLVSLPYSQTLEDMRAASDAFLARLGYRREGAHYLVERRHSDTVALFCHGGFGLTWLSLLLGIPTPLLWAGFFLPTSSITTILWDERETGIATPRCLGVGTLPHLARAGMSMSPAGIKANLD